MVINIQNIVDNLNKDNSIFSNSGKYLKDSIEFAKYGISDTRLNYFYIRPLNLSPLQNRLSNTNTNGIYSIQTQYRAVFQFQNVDPDQAIQSMVYQLEQYDEVSVNAFSSDAAGIYYAEYKSDRTPGFIIISVDFTLTVERGLQYCGCLNIKQC